MRIAIIGRTEILFDTAQRLHAAGHKISLVVTASESSEYRCTATDFARMADGMGARFFNNLAVADVAAAIAAEGPIDVAVSMNFPSILPDAVIEQFPLGVLNAHGGDLPRYRGNACQAWAILSGEERIGLCIHRMIGGELDSGDIIARDYLPVRLDTTITQVWGWMLKRIPVLYEQAIDRLESNPAYVLERQSKNPKEALRCYPRIREDGRIDWTRPAVDIVRLVNASTRPYAGAFCSYEAEELIVWSASLVEEFEQCLAVPGQVTHIGDGFVEVAAGIGKVRVDEVGWRSEICAPSSFIHSIRKRLS